MSDRPDLGKIKPPEQPPSDEPDTRTQDEVRDITSPRRLTSTERELEARREHVLDLRARIVVHCDDTKAVRLELATVRTDHAAELATLRSAHAAELGTLWSDLAAALEQARTLTGRVKEMETATGFVWWLALGANLLTTVGGVLISIAGAAPLQETTKVALTVTGTTAAAIGLTLMATVAVLARHYLSRK